ncbi:M10 family metallopeptidase C-terminal domain-containing protein [Rhizobium sp. TRM95796]|uniref:M10 family metallopeptidase C-terminal domain-containing protein n=1 Tax=Rhizobium sp. TRM95796 TaxID=2979862 RepID=UPI0021E79CD7|nr:hypothetical protein [Rhizobium sp. TRM95796]MCV3766587.1 hypothetical protein [Rhizobium sp. TRM95796]
MAIAFTATLGTEWTDVVINEESGEIVWTNFEGNVVPGGADDVVVATAGVTISNNVFDHHSPLTGEVATRNLDVTSAGSVIADASLMTIGGTLSNDGAFTILTDSVTVLGGIVNNHLMTISGESGSAYLLMDSGEFHLSGSGDLRLTSNVDGTAFLTGTLGAVTTLHNESRISGVGQIGWSFQQYFPGGYVAIINSGVIDADVSGRRLIIAPGVAETDPLVNTGALVSNGGGQLIVDNAFVDQSSSGYVGAYGAGSKTVLNNTALTGGLLDTSGGGVIYLETGGGYVAAGGGPGYTILDGSTEAGAVTITTDSLVRLGVPFGIGTEAQIAGDIVNHGEIGLLGYWTALRVASSARLTGGGEVVLSYSAGAGDNVGFAMLQGASDTVESTLENVDNVIRGAGYVGRYDNGALATKLLSVVNHEGGVFEADNADAALVIYGTVGFVNAGVLRAVDGAELSIGVNSGSTAIDNKDGAILADGVDSTVVIRSGEVRGGSLETANGGLIQLVGFAASVLDGSTGQGAVTNHGAVRIDGGLFRGAIVNDGDIGFHPTQAATLLIDGQGAALSGAGVLTLGANSMIRGENSSEIAVLANSGVIAGGGYIGTTQNGPGTELFELRNMSGGVVRATTGETMVIDTSGAIVNDGVFEADGGALVIQDLLSGAGAVRAVNGGVLTLRGDWTGTVTFSGAGAETLRHSIDGPWSISHTITLGGFGLGDRVDLAQESGYSLSEPDNFAWTQSGENGVFQFSGAGEQRGFAFNGLSQFHLSLVDNGNGGLFLERVATIDGTKGANVLSGTAGDDRMVGFAGKDSFRGSAGNDRMDGGVGIDTVDYGAASGGVRVNLAATTLQAIGGGQGSDMLLFFENAAGGGFNDRLTGNSGVNVLKGGGGNDTLIGGGGFDLLYGGSGRDSFVMKSAKDIGATKTASDTIYDFNGKSGDRINLSGIDANAATAKNDAFSFIDTAAFSGKAGELRYERAKSDTYISGDVNGDGKADFVLHLDDPMSLSRGFFVL